MSRDMVMEAVRRCANMDSYSISIGGGEPTLHPDFFDILKLSLRYFDYVWMATNGSQTKTMYRLDNIIQQCDYESFECNCGEEDCNGGCNDNNIIFVEKDKLGVALSQDYFHDLIDQRIVDLWTRRVKSQTSGYEIRNVTQSYKGVIAAGRAKRTGNYQCEDECVCPGLMVRVNGNIYPCGCKGVPIVGSIWSGLNEEGRAITDFVQYTDSECYTKYLKASKHAA